MCGGSGNILRWPVDETAILGSRMGAQLGRTLHWQGLVDEAKHNEANPGRAETKAAINAALWYLGGEAGSALGGAGGAAANAGSAAGEGAYNAMTAAQIAEQGAPMALGENVGTVLGSTSGATTAALGQEAAQVGLQGGLLGAGGTPTLQQLGQLSQAQNFAPVVDNSIQAQPTALRMASDYAARANTAARSFIPSGSMPAAQQSAAPLYENSINAAKSAASNSTLRNMALNMGTKMLTPQQRQQPMAPPAPQGPQGPLSNPYQQGNPYQNSLSMGLTEDQKQRLRAMGYQV